jgi:PIN domain nuclease of toxin-antitoxin system
MLVLDASAYLACLFRETGHDLVAPRLRECCLSTVNLAEVIGRFTRDGHDASVVAPRLIAAVREIVPFSEGQAILTATLLPVTRSLGLSLGDRACLALALVRRCPVLTADRSWAKLKLAVEIHIIR